MKPNLSIIPRSVPTRAAGIGNRPLRIVYSRDETSGPAKAIAKTPRVLIVEDDYLVAMQMESALTEAGFDVAGLAGSADEALELVAAQPPVLVVMDVRLSGQRDGIDAALELFKKYGVRCVFATAHHTAEARARAEPAQPLAWVPKPYTMPALIDAVRSAFRDLTNQ